jgi:hypothetical protein
VAKTHQDWVAYSLDGSNRLGVLRRFGMSSAGNLVDGSAGNSSVFKGCEVSRTIKHSFTLLEDASGSCRATNLNLTVLTIGAVDRLASFKSGTVGMSLSGSASVRPTATLKERMQALQRKFTVAGTFRVDDGVSLIDLETIANSNTPADRDVTVLVTIAGIAFSIPMTIETFDFNSEHNAVQEFTATLVSRDVASTPTGTSIYAVAFTGDGLLTLASDLGSGNRSGTGLVESLSITIPEAGLMEVTGTMTMQGGMTLATS